jgi:hypothetical protein
VRLRVDPTHAPSLVAHLADQGFPAERVRDDEVDVLFPGSAWIFDSAAELDEWRARIGSDAPVDVDA